MSAGPTEPRAPSGATLELFMTHLAKIAPRLADAIRPDSRLLADLGFDSLAFTRLALLLFEHYHVEEVSTAALRSSDQTVAEFFASHVGAGRPARA